MVYQANVIYLASSKLDNSNSVATIHTEWIGRVYFGNRCALAKL